MQYVLGEHLTLKVVSAPRDTTSRPSKPIRDIPTITDYRVAIARVASSRSDVELVELELSTNRI